MSLSFHLWVRGIFFLFVWGVCQDVGGIVRRHDVADTEYVSAATNFPTVGYLATSGTIRGSGVLVGVTTNDLSRWVLTAAHIVSPNQFVIQGVTYPVVEFVRHPSWDGSAGGILGGGGSLDDIALALIQVPAGSSLPSPSLWHGSDADLQVGLLLDTVGAGRPGDGLTGESGSAGTLRAAQNTLQAIGSRSPLTPVATVFEYRFHAPGNSAVRPREGMAVFLDSGGPVWADFGNGDVVIGVHSYVRDNDGQGRGTYGDELGATRVPLYDTWIRDVMDAYADEWVSVSTLAVGAGSILPAEVVNVPAGTVTNFVLEATNEDHHIASIEWNDAELYVNSGNRGMQMTNMIVELEVNSSLVVSFSPSATISGIPLSWLTGYGITNKTDAIEDKDLDGDTFTVLEEYWADTHPIDSNDFFSVQGITRNSGTNLSLMLSRTSTQRVYKIDRASSLPYPYDWQSITSFPGSGATWSEDIPVEDEGLEFFRATVLVP